MARKELLTDIAAIGAAGLMGFREGRELRRRRGLEERQEARAEKREEAELARARVQEAREERILAGEEARERREAAEERRKITTFERTEPEARAAEARREEEAERAGKKFGMEEREGAEKVRQGAAATLFNLSRVWEDLPEGRMTGLVFDPEVKAALGLKFPGRTVKGMTKKADGLVTLTFTEGAPENIDPLILRDAERGLMSPEAQKLALVLDEARRPPGLKEQVEAGKLVLEGRDVERRLAGLEPPLSSEGKTAARRVVREALEGLADVSLTQNRRKLMLGGILERARGAGIEWETIAGELSDADRRYMAALASRKGLAEEIVTKIAPVATEPGEVARRERRRKQRESGGIVGAGGATTAARPTAGVAAAASPGRLSAPRTHKEAFDALLKLNPLATDAEIEAEIKATPSLQRLP